MDGSGSALLALLKDYSRLEIRIPQNDQERNDLRRAIIWICGQSETENFGICADDQHSAEAALGQYLRALDYDSAHRAADLCEIAMEEQTIQGPVYLKCQSQSLRFYVASYEGSYRGVLISCQTEDEALAGTYGYFPLDLFAD
ncbi:DUF1824 family protein [Synechocystis sp. PCC 7339]|uniref:DUF1824 family protein n=1 Tax=unclassified Synechocystis TaxID=2640012 RepID=UPI001BB02EC6|nr:MULTISPECIES: DUF1824 family protein [unclassified Synechocystis]QUS61570.1 DUF1824 family protein [Synechocystis sp. PCC 7338]UAJ73767.1 DUF1824 family protein [Synechocystis sp. PCC 7339]